MVCGGRQRRFNVRAKAILGVGEPLITTDHILIEAWLLLRHRLSRNAAERFWEALRAGVALIEPIGVADLESTSAIGQAFSDQDSSVVDRTSFAVMQRLRIRRVATFDNDFAIFRYGRKLERTFEIVR